ncbi:MAG: hypothetical protein J6X65_01385 [Bacteroidales bacterium]|nr:hypothetical protein [Bacteroidales bacterium]
MRYLTPKEKELINKIREKFHIAEKYLLQSEGQNDTPTSIFAYELIDECINSNILAVNNLHEEQRQIYTIREASNNEEIISLYLLLHLLEQEKYLRILPRYLNYDNVKIESVLTQLIPNEIAVFKESENWEIFIFFLTQRIIFFPAFSILSINGGRSIEELTLKDANDACYLSNRTIEKSKELLEKCKILKNESAKQTRLAILAILITVVASILSLVFSVWCKL